MLAAHVDMTTRHVHVTYDPRAVSEAAMAQAVARVDLRLRVRHWLHHLLGGRRRRA